jgi:hypothetical protein
LGSLKAIQILGKPETQSKIAHSHADGDSFTIFLNCVPATFILATISSSMLGSRSAINLPVVS